MTKEHAWYYDSIARRGRRSRVAGRENPPLFSFSRPFFLSLGDEDEWWSYRYRHHSQTTSTVKSMVCNKPVCIIALLLLDTSNARSLSLPTRYLNPYHVLNDLAPRRRFLKLINIDPRNNARRRGATEQTVQILTSGKQQMYMRCFAIVFIWWDESAYCILITMHLTVLLPCWCTIRIAIGTLFYSFYNNWPLAQAFFYAGMPYWLRWVLAIIYNMPNHLLPWQSMLAWA